METPLLQDDGGSVNADKKASVLYARRWLVLALFFVASSKYVRNQAKEKGYMGVCSQGNVWLTLAPVTKEAEMFFGISANTIAILLNYGPILYVVAVTPFSWLIAKNLRWAVVLAAWLVACGTVLRLFAGRERTAWLHVCAILNGVAGPVFMGAPTALTSVWFGVHERTTATAIAGLSNAFGSTVGFLLVPWMTFRWDIRTMLRGDAVLACCIALLVSLLFFKEPPTTPSLSSSIERINFFDSLPKALKNRELQLLCWCGGCLAGLLSAWSSLINVILDGSRVEFSDRVWGLDTKGFLHSASWVGFVASTAGNVMGLWIGPIADRMERRMKTLLLVLVFLAVISFGAFSLVVAGTIVAPVWMIMVLAVCGSVFVCATIPLFYELCAETAYPLPEAVSSGLLTVLWNLFTLLFYVIGLGGLWKSKPWMGNYIVVFGSALVLLVLPWVQPTFSRLDVDT